ncbi:MAG: hypothetical protein Q8P95_00850 [bacterium]|nr:hypothetical protein [bacterium]
MPVLLYLAVFLAALATLAFMLARRTHMLRETRKLQEELKKQRQKAERAQKRERRQLARVEKELKRAETMKHQSLRHLGAVSELMKKVDHDLANGNQQEALKALIEVTSLDENHQRANELMAQIYLDTQQSKKAEIIYKKLIGLYPFDAKYYGALAQSFLDRHQFKVAQDYFEEALKLDKNNARRYMDLGMLHAMRHEYRISMDYYLKAHHLNLRDVPLMFTIVQNCLSNSDPITAREFLHKILDYEPYNEEAKNLLAGVLRELKEEA